MATEEMKASDDPRDRREEPNNDDDDGGIKKACADCKTTKTPLWRGGPTGPKSLCNACGIKYRKKRLPSTAGASSSPPSVGKRGRSAEAGKKALSESMKMSLAILGKDLMFQTSAVAKKQRCQRKRKLREEELAAVALMAMSCGSVFA